MANYLGVEQNVSTEACQILEPDQLNAIRMSCGGKLFHGSSRRNEFA
jgi:hypothetical protein